MNQTVKKILKKVTKFLTRTIQIRDLKIDFRFPDEQNINSIINLGQKLSLIVLSFLTITNFWFIFGVLFLLLCDISLEDEIIEV